MKEKLIERRTIINTLISSNEIFYLLGGITIDEYNTYQKMLLAAISSDLILTDYQVNVIKISKVVSDLTKFKALMFVFQMGN